MQTTQAYAPHNLRLGARVKALRKTHPASPTAIAAGCQISTNSLWNIERGRGCRSETLAHLGQFFGVSLDYLMGLTEAAPPDQAPPSAGATPPGRPRARRRDQAALTPG
jgi:transcriptional regulator with XRE-family HTH domain